MLVQRALSQPQPEFCNWSPGPIESGWMLVTTFMCDTVPHVDIVFCLVICQLVILHWPVGCSTSQLTNGSPGKNIERALFLTISCCTSFIYHSIMLNIKWPHFDRSVEQHVYLFCAASTEWHAVMIVFLWMFRSWSKTVWSSVDGDVCVGCDCADCSTSACSARDDSRNHHTYDDVHRAWADTQPSWIVKCMCFYQAKVS